MPSFWKKEVANGRGQWVDARSSDDQAADRWQPGLSAVKREFFPIFPAGCWRALGGMLWLFQLFWVPAGNDSARHAHQFCHRGAASFVRLVHGVSPFANRLLGYASRCTAVVFCFLRQPCWCPWRCRWRNRPCAAGVSRRPSARPWAFGWRVSRQMMQAPNAARPGLRRRCGGCPCIHDRLGRRPDRCCASRLSWCSARRWLKRPGFCAFGQNQPGNGMGFAGPAGGLRANWVIICCMPGR